MLAEGFPTYSVTCLGIKSHSPFAGQSNQEQCFSLLLQVLGQSCWLGAEDPHGNVLRGIHPHSQTHLPGLSVWIFFPGGMVATGSSTGACWRRQLLLTEGGHALLPAGGKAEAPRALPQWRRHSASH